MKNALLPVALVAATLASGCSFTWGEGGIGDVLFGGQRAKVPGVENQDQNAPGAGGGKETGQKAQVPQEVEGSQLHRIAILPVAYVDGTGGQPCDLCPAEVAMKPTDRLTARLVTGFVYEAVARHPRFLFPPHSVVEKAVETAPSKSFRQAMANLAATGRADYVIATALVELRPRVGDHDDPEQAAGVVLYSALINAKSGEMLWSDTFDDNESSRGIFLGTYDKVANDRPIRWSTAQEYSEQAADALIEDLVDKLD